MIWAWIAIAWVISLFLLRKKAIRFHNYIWTLIPIDMYGISVAGAIIKPYMVFSVLLLVVALAKSRTTIRNEIRVPIFLCLILAAGLFVVDLSNGLLAASIAQHILFCLVVSCGFIYVMQTDVKKELGEILTVMSMAAIAYGIVFCVAWMLFSSGVTDFGVYAPDRSDAGMVLRYSDMNSVEFAISYRLRGFYNDPNPLMCMFVLPLAFAALSLLKKDPEGLGKLESIATIFLSLACAYFTNSRMALLTCLFALLVALLFYAVITKRFALFVLLTALSVAILTVMIISNVFPGVYDAIEAHFGYRSSFGDEYGRGNIWTTNLSLVWNGPLFTGFGQNQIQYVSSLGAPCHNTWLEWICGDGLIVGMLGVYLFLLLPLVRHLAGLGSKAVMGRGVDVLSTSFVVGHLSILLILSVVDFVSNTYLIFTTLLVYAACPLGNNAEGKVAFAVDVTNSSRTTKRVSEQH